MGFKGGLERESIVSSAQNSVCTVYWVVKQKYVKVKYLHAIVYSAVKLTLQECMEEHVLRAVINV